MRQALTSSVVVAGSLLVLTCAAGLAGTGGGAATVWEPARLEALPAELRASRFGLFRVSDSPQAEAENLFATALAALYLPEREEALLLTAAGAEELAAASGEGLHPLAARLHPEGAATLEEFAAAVAARLRPGERWLLMLPAVEAGEGEAPASQGLTPLSPGAVVVHEDFEDDPWGRWSRRDNKGGAYAFARTACSAHGGSHSVDTVRGGTLGAGLACDATYPLSTETWMEETACESLAGAGEAWLEFYLHQTLEAVFDYTAVFYRNAANSYCGYSFSGSFSAWWRVVLNLKQWAFIGDVTALACPRLSFKFRSDTSNTPGFGARIDDIAVQTEGRPTLSCAASAAPASGKAPLDVQFSSQVVGASAAATYSWSFNDGSSASGPTASHTYTRGGTFWPSLVVRDGSNYCFATARVEVAPPCTVAVSATVPAAAQAGTAVPFRATATPTNCGADPVSYSWSFGDGATSAEQNPSHVYGAAGSYGWRVTATVGGATASQSGTITVAGAPLSYLVPAVAQIAGAGGTQWRTAVAVVNRNTETASVELEYRSDTTTATRTLALGPGKAVKWTNVLQELFGLPASAQTSGVLVVRPDRRVYVTARTYNQSASGTFGQHYPALTTADALVSGQVGYLPHLQKNAAFRTNLGLVNLGAQEAVVTVSVHDASGGRLGSELTWTLQPGTWRQQYDVFAAAGAGERDVAYGKVRVAGTDARVWAYASVVDNRTGDPTTFPVRTGAPAGTLVAVPEAGEAEALAAPPALPEPQPEAAVDAAYPATTSPYAGSWSGTTSDNLPVGFRVLSDGTVADFYIRLELRLGLSYCRGNATPQGQFPLTGDTLQTRVTFPQSNVTSDVTGTFSSTTAISGSYTGYSGSFYVVCGGLTFGTGSPLSAGTWSAQRASPLTATASANPTSGVAPLLVRFTAAATGGVAPLTYSWRFGDGGTSTSQNPTHTYQDAGTFQAVLTVRDAMGSEATSAVTITVAPQALAATATAAPARGAAPLVVRLSGSATHGTPPYTFTWEPGDGSPAVAGQEVTHTYAAPGTYTARLLVRDAAAATASATASVEVLEATAAHRCLVPAVAHAPGAGGTRWRTSLAMVNPTASPAQLALTYRTSGGTLRSTLELPPGGAVQWANVLGQLFGWPAEQATSGSLEIGSSVAVCAAARTYNDGAGGTFGQYYPALPAGGGLARGDVGVIPQLERTAVARTNIGLLNLGATGSEVRVRLYSGDGFQVGSDTLLTVAPGQWVQQYDIFSTCGAGYREVAYATVEVLTEGGRVWAYAAVVDNATGDPTTIPVLWP